MTMETEHNRSDVHFQNFSDCSLEGVFEIDDKTLEGAFGITGIIMAAFNVFSLTYLVRMINRTSKNEKHFYLQLFFVSINDIISGIIMFCHVLVPVTSSSAATICGLLVIIQVSLICSTQVNIVLVSVQRFLFALNARYNLKWSTMLKIRVLVIGNVLAGLCPMVFLLVMLNSRLYHCMNMCAPIAVYTNSEIELISILGPIMLMPGTIIATMFSIAALRHFSNVLRTIFPTGGTSTSCNQSPNDAKQVEKHILVTLVLILSMFALFMIPFIIVILLILAQVNVSETVLGMTLCISYFNSISSPIIYMCRLSKYRTLIREDCEKASSVILQWCRLA